METVWVSDNNQARIICPKCKFSTNIDVTKLKSAQRTKKAKCKCGEIYQFTIDFRRQYRKDVRLPGEYVIQGKKVEIIIRDLSMSGIKFESFSPHQISTDDILEVRFRLNNSSKKEIRKKVQVIWVDGLSVGAQYTERKG